MKCASCGTENLEGAKFCQECGSALARSCVRCRTPLAAAAKFCMSCGHPVAGTAPVPAPAEPVASLPNDRMRRYIPEELLAKLEAARAGGGMQGERRVVTILFCDVKGSTAAAERLDPEEWADIMNGAFEHLIAPIYRYEGTLARLMGDAILAFFGAPIAHEDDPQRAVLAGLAIVREIVPYQQKVKRNWGIDLDVRVGINTGLVVVGDVGSDLRLEYTAMGDAVNLAARMEQTAAPGTVRIAAATHKHVAPLLDVEDLGEVEVKGKQEPVHAFRVIGPRARPGRLRGLEGIDSPLVGRDREMAVLRGQADALRRGSGQIVSLIAEAGLGKSRLVAELRRALENEGALAHIGFFEGRTLSYQSSTPYAPIADLLRNLVGSDYATVFRAAGEAVGAERAGAVAPYLASLLGLPLEGEAVDRVRYLEPPALHAKVVGAVAEVVEGVAAKRPLLLVFEDLHWADTSSLQVIEGLLPLVDRTGLMLVPVFRPRPQEPSWRLHEVAAREQAHRYLPLMLEPLQEDDTRTLVSNLLRIEGLTEKVRSLILSKAEGNPYFVEEVVRSLIDQGLIVRDGEHWRATRDIGSIAIPDTLAGVLSARLDRLDETGRRAAQVAAVIGREFDFDVLASVVEPLSAVEETLSELQRRGLVRERSRTPKRVYLFKHVLVQEAAYESLLHKTRREIHRKVADVLARIDPDRSADIARHFLEAREGERALPHLVAAAERAAKAYSTPEAIRLFDRALEIIEGGVPDAELATRAYEGRGNALQLAMDIPAATANWQAMIRWADARSAEPLRVSGLNKLAMIHALMLGDGAEGERLLDEAETVARKVSCQPGLIEGSMIRCALHLGRAEFDRANGYLEEAAELGKALQAEEPMLFGMTHVANTLLFRTEYDLAWPRIREALAKAEELGNQKYVSELKAFSVPTYLMREGNVEGAKVAAREGVEIAERIGNAPDLCVGVSLLGRIASLQGHHEEAIACNERAVVAGRASFPYNASMALCTLGTSYVQVSERLHERALALHREALEMLKQPTGAAFGALCWCELGFCALEIGNLERAREMFEQGLTVPTALIRMYRPSLLVGAAMVALRQDRLQDARRHVVEARAFAEERKMRHDYALVRLAEARVSAAEGARARALALYDEAEALAGGLGYRSLLWQARAEAARLLEQAGDGEAARRRREGAREVLAEIAGLIRDDDLRAGFLAKAERALGARAG
jgi:class 3 adenylate cyclase/tetratricopeptide (TPR) repeat protein